MRQPATREGGIVSSHDVMRPVRAKAVAKSEFLQIRLSPEDRERVRRAAAQQFLDTSTWARQVILKALSEAEKSGSQPHP